MLFLACKNKPKTLENTHGGEHERKPLAKKLPASRVLRWVVGIPVILALVLYGASYLLDEPLRRNTEKKLNRDLKGYSVRLQSVHVQLIGLTATLTGLTVLQQANPDLPVAYFPIVKANIHWRGLLAGRLVGELMLDRPKININLLQLRSETAGRRRWRTSTRSR
jgi:hypothetical protein